MEDFKRENEFSLKTSWDENIQVSQSTVFRFREDDTAGDENTAYLEIREVVSFFRYGSENSSGTEISKTLEYQVEYEARNPIVELSAVVTVGSSYLECVAAHMSYNYGIQVKDLYLHYRTQGYTVAASLKSATVDLSTDKKGAKKAVTDAMMRCVGLGWLFSKSPSDD